MYTDEKNLAELLREVVGEFGELAKLHLALARAEVERDAREVMADILPFLVAIPLLALGYVILCFAVAVALVPWAGPAGGLFIVAGVHLLGGIVAVSLAIARLKRGFPVRLSVGTELQQTVHSLEVRSGPQQELHDG